MQTALRKDVEPGALTVRHVLVVITGILICFGPATMVLNTWSILVVPVCTSLDVSTNAFTFYVSAMFIAMAVTAVFAGNIMERFDLRIVLSVSCVLATGGILLCSFYTEVWQFYVSGLLEGPGVLVLLSLAAPTLVSRWFHRHMGLLIGICVACTGIGAAVWNMLGGVLLNEYDWRTCYLVFGIVGAAISIVPCIFFVRSYPKDVGLTPFGIQERKDETEEKPEEFSVPAKQAFRTPAFVLLCITISLANGTAELANYLATYVYHLSDLGVAGVTAATAVIIASIVVACLQIAQAGAKVILGHIADYSLRVAFTIACVCGLVGVLLVWQGSAVGAPAVYGGSAFYGVFFSTTYVLGPTVARYLFGPKDYTPIYSRASIFISLTPALFVQIYSWLCDTNWGALFGVTIVLIGIMLVCSLLLISQIKRLRRSVSQDG